MYHDVTKIIAVEEHFMLEDVDALYNRIFENSVTDSVRISKARFIADFVAKGDITEIGEKRQGVITGLQLCRLEMFPLLLLN